MELVPVESIRIQILMEPLDSPGNVVFAVRLDTPKTNVLKGNRTTCDVNYQ